MYKLINSTSILRLSDNAYIPADPANSDYANYLAWCAAGNIPQPADQPTTESLRAAALSTLPAWESAERAAGIDHAGRKWLTTPAALQDIRDALMAEAAPPGGVWIDANRQPVSMTLADLKALWGSIFARGAAIYQRRLEMEQAIATMPRAGLEAFKPGWPAPKP